MSGPTLRRSRVAGLLVAAIIGSLPIGAVAGGGAAFELQGHRGARALAPENTLPGFDAALAVGVDTLEFDVVLTRDRVVVLSHDRLLNPDITRDAAGRWLTQPGPAIRSIDFAQLQRYDVGRSRPGSSHARRHPLQRPADGSRMPSLAQVFEHLAARGADRIRYNIEIKTSPLEPDASAAPDELAAALIAEVRRHGVAGRTTIQSFDWRALQAVQRLAPDIETVYLSAQRPGFDTIEAGGRGASPWTAGFAASSYGSVPRMVKAAGGAVWSPAHADLQPALVREAQGLGLRVIPWTVNDVSTMHRLIDWGVDGIITDRPDLLRQVMAERGMPVPPPLH